MTQGSLCQPMRPSAPLGDKMPGLGPTTDVVYEWWNEKLLLDKHLSLHIEMLKAEREVEIQRLQGLPPWDGRRKLTTAEKTVQKKRERMTRIELLCGTFERDALYADKVRLARDGKPDENGPHRFHFKGRMRRVRVEYARMGRFDIGRRYPKNVPSITRTGDELAGEDHRKLGVTAQGMPKDIRAFCFPYLRDIDMVACHPAILASKAREFGIAVPGLDDYVKHTESRREEVMSKHNVPKDLAKVLFTLLLYGGSYAHRVEEWKKKYGHQRRIDSTPIPRVVRLEKELVTLRDAVMARDEFQDRVPGIMAHEATKISKFTGKPKNEKECKCSTWSQITQDWEDQALGCVQRALEGAGLVVHALLFDGCQVYHDPNVDMEAAMAAASARIKEELGMDLQLTEKELYDAKRMAKMV